MNEWMGENTDKKNVIYQQNVNKSFLYTNKQMHKLRKKKL